MPFWYFFTVPKLPVEVSDRSNRVEVREYLLKEGDLVAPGAAVAIVENRWATIRLKANGYGILQKTIFSPGTDVQINDPIAVIGADGENIPYGKNYSIAEVVEIKREKPSKDQSHTVENKLPPPTVRG
jgi:pyruvate/2-oxoglutarate dehydrogenase complex dihydrolipoamide acyltransferase (E2) component